MEQRGVFLSEAVFAANCKSFSSFESGADQVQLIELYTSEGCSSCPPAEKWMNSLYNKDRLYKDFVPVAFHVDYWDYIGHADPLASPIFTQRQRKYAKQWSASNIYTPGFVLNGREWRSMRRNAPKATKKKVGNLVVSKLKDGYRVSFSKKGNFEVYAALMLHGIENKIKRGENRGKILKHNFVVNELVKKKFTNGESELITFAKPKLKHIEQSLVFWISKSGSQKPIQVAGHCL